MATTGRLGIDLANVFDDDGKCIGTLAWGDAIEVVKSTTAGLTIKFPRFQGGEIVEGQGLIKKPSKSSGIKLEQVVIGDDTGEDENATRVLKVDFVDVQQGDGAVIETPSGKVILLDGGDNVLFARYLAARFAATTKTKPKKIDAIVVTHGDADHFLGLVEIFESEQLTGRKRLFIAPRRVFHNGLVKAPTKQNNQAVPEAKQLGDTIGGGDEPLIITRLVDDPRQVARTDMNQPFQKWADALDAWETRGTMTVKRLEHGSNEAFRFLQTDKVKVKVLGPFTVDAGGVPGLPFLGEPAPRVAAGPGGRNVKFTGISASHTINGHSVILQLQFGKFRFLFAGDLNEEAEERLLEADAAGQVDLTSEVLKVPHHGSADYSPKFIAAVEPVVSVISSGDENERKEFIHPRATIMAALGRHSRKDVEEPLVLVTELAAFFKVEGTSRLADDKAAAKRKNFFGFSRSAFGMIKVRTDGQRMLVYTYSGKDDLKEAYAFRFDNDKVVADVVRKA